MTKTARAPRIAIAADERRSQLIQRFESVRAATLALAAGLSPEDCMLQSMPDASPVKWHLAHTSWFFETFILETQAPHYRHFDPQYRVLFNSYYVGVGERHPRPERGMISRPGLEEIRSYRRHVDDAIVRWLASGTATPQALGLLELGLHHEQQHQELLVTDFKHALSRNPLKPAYRQQQLRTGANAAQLRWREFPAGLRVLFRQRETAPPRVLECIHVGKPSGYKRRVPCVHGRRRLSAARAMAVRRVGHPHRAGLGGASVLGA
jgi:hypothetical protein